MKASRISGTGLLLALAGGVFAQGAPPPEPVPAAVRPAPPALRIELFSPQGRVKGVRQVMVRFNQAVTALGDPRLADPMAIDCPAPGKGRWADGRNWVYDFDADLPAGIRCRFTPRKSLTSLAGARLSTARRYEFDTGGPSVIDSLPREGWSALDEDQVFLLKLDAPATAESIAAGASCIVEGIAEHIPVQLLDGSERAAVLRERAALGYDYLRLLWKDGRAADARVRNRAFDKAEDQLTLLRCRRRLPPDSEVRLVWGKGIRTPSGLATTADQTLAFKVRAAFTAQVECTRTNPTSGCVPMLPIEVNFTAPVPRALALLLALQPLRFQAPAPGTGGHPRGAPLGGHLEGVLQQLGQSLEHRFLVGALGAMAGRDHPQHAAAADAGGQPLADARLLFGREAGGGPEVEEQGDPALHFVDVLAARPAAPRCLEQELGFRHAQAARNLYHRRAMLARRA